MKTRSYLLLGSVLLFLFVPTPGFTEDESSGRLQDGRAFRVDSNGNRLVDHIAELEVATAELEKQVAILQDELDEKDRLLARRQSGDVAASNGSCDAQIQPVAAELQSAKASCERDINGLKREINGFREQVSSLEVQVASLRKGKAKLQKASIAPGAYNQLENQLAAIQAREHELKERELELKENLLQSEAEVSKLATQLALAEKKSASLESTQDELKFSRANALEETTGEVAQAYRLLEEKQAELARVENALGSSYDKLASLNDEIASIKRENLSLEKQLASLEEDASKANFNRARLTSPKSDAASAQVASIESPEVEPMVVTQKTVIADADLGTMKTNFKRQLASIQKLIGARKSLIDKAKERRSSVSLRISPLVTQDGQSLDELRLEVAKLSSDSEIKDISKGISEIELALKDDIQVLSRLARGS